MARPNRYQVPAAPIQRELRAYMRTIGATTANDPGYGSPLLLHLIERIWPDGSRAPKTCSTRIRRLLTESTSMSFDLADRILCALERTELWHSDPELAERYQEVSLSRSARWEREARVDTCATLVPVDVRPQGSRLDNQERVATDFNPNLAP